MLRTKGLLLAASVAISSSGIARVAPAGPGPGPAPASVSVEPGKIVEGATPSNVAQIERCQGHKFESTVQIDPVKKRSTRIKLCANPGSTDADWVKTLEAAIDQLEQRAIAPEAKDKLIGEIRIEMAKFAGVSRTPAPAQGISAFSIGGTSAGGSLIPPAERFETSTLPPLPPHKTAAARTAGIKAPAQPPMRIRIKCLERGETGAGGTCDFFDRNTILAISAVEGLEGGAILRFLRRGETRDEIQLAPMQAGQSQRVRLPAELCRGVSHSKVEIHLLGPQSAGQVAARLGPYGLRC